MSSSNWYSNLKFLNRKDNAVDTLDQTSSDTIASTEWNFINDASSCVKNYMKEKYQLEVDSSDVLAVSGGVVMLGYMLKRGLTFRAVRRLEDQCGKIAESVEAGMLYMKQGSKEFEKLKFLVDQNRIDVMKLGEKVIFLNLRLDEAKEVWSKTDRQNPTSKEGYKEIEKVLQGMNDEARKKFCDFITKLSGNEMTLTSFDPKLATILKPKQL